MTPRPDTEAEKALKKRAIQIRRYRKHRREEFARLYAIPEHGSRLRQFALAVRAFGMMDADRMVEFVRAWATTEIPDAAIRADIRAAALSLINNRVMRIREMGGMPPIDDPLWDEPDDVFRLCRAALK